MPIDTRDALILSSSDVDALMRLFHALNPSPIERFKIAQAFDAVSVMEAIREFVRDRQSDD